MPDQAEVCVCPEEWLCSVVCMVRESKGSASVSEGLPAGSAFPYAVHAWLVYCDTAEPDGALNIWIFNAGSMISQTGPLIISFFLGEVDGILMNNKAGTGELSV
jgi:hypothetical protein